MFNNSVNQIFQYNGSPITFQKGDSVMVNATEMAKPFGKRSNDFLSSKSTKELICSLSIKTGISATDLVIVNQGGNNQGTWMHEDLALVFAQWLSPDFYLWCNDRIKELLTTGVTTVANDDEAIAYAMSVLQKRLEQAKVEKAMLEADNAAKEETIELQQKELAQAAPKVQYVDTVLQSVNTYATNLIAKEMGMSAETLNKRLKEKGIQYRQSGVWVLTSKYQNKGYTKTRTHTYTRSDGYKARLCSPYGRNKAGHSCIHYLKHNFLHTYLFSSPL